MSFNATSLFIKNVTFGHISKQVFRRCYSADSKQEKLKAHQAKIMAKNLPKVKPIDGVKSIVLVSSGKGGVGKTTTAVNLATAMKIVKPSKQIGLLDADVFGPSVPLMMNLNDSPILNKQNLMEPLINYGVKCMSMGFLVDEKAPVIWRGLMVMQAMERLMRQVYWGELECLIIDTPPGTGDTHLSLVQNLPINGVVLVSTPTTASVNITRKGAVMYRKLNVPIIGIVENMCAVKCPSCSTDVQLFGDNVKNFAKEFNIDLMESFPLEQEISDGGDKGVPLVIANPQSKQSEMYKNLANNVYKFLNVT